eukprot:g8681.t2
MIVLTYPHHFAINSTKELRPSWQIRALQKKTEKISKPNNIPNEIILTEKHNRKNLLFTANGHWSVESTDSHSIKKRTKPITDAIFSLFLPTGFPRTVSSDYLTYQLWTLPTHITGWVSASLATSSLLRAVGVSNGVAATASLTAAIKWITKDGVGAIGKLLVGGRLGVYFDEDPRLWRMIAESVSTVGLSLEIATVFYPNHFLLLAGGGNFAKAFAKGMAKPSFRVIQQHFVRFNNIGEISAKEESWEVAGQTVGLITSVGILSLLEGSADWHPVLLTWAAFHTVHVICRYLALNALQFDSINTSRAHRLMSMHIQDSTVADPQSVAEEESFLLDWLVSGPEIEYGVSLSDLSQDFRKNEFQSWVEIFSEEKFLLSVKQGKAYVVLKESYSSLDALKAFWQFLWIRNKTKIDNPNLHQLHEALLETNRQFPDFTIKAKAAGWNLDNTLFRVGIIRVLE